MIARIPGEGYAKITHQFYANINPIRVAPEASGEFKPFNHPVASPLGRNIWRLTGYALNSAMVAV